MGSEPLETSPDQVPPRSVDPESAPGESHGSRVGRIRPDIFHLPVALGHTDGHGRRHEFEPLQCLIPGEPRRVALGHIEVEAGPRTEGAIGLTERDAAAPHPAHAAIPSTQGEFPVPGLGGALAEFPPASGLLDLAARRLNRGPELRFRLLERGAEKGEESRTHEGEATGGVRAPHAEIERFTDRPVALFAVLERLRRPLFVIDIRRGTHPTEDRVVRIADRNATGQKPAQMPQSIAQAKFCPQRFPPPQRLLAKLVQLADIFRRQFRDDRFLRDPLCAGVIGPAGIDVLQRAVRPPRVDDVRQRIEIELESRVAIGERLTSARVVAKRLIESPLSRVHAAKQRDQGRA